MFHHKKKLCYVPFPKSGSSSLRNHLTQYGFTKTINGRLGGTNPTITDILEKTKHIKDIDSYTFFTVHRDGISHFKSAYKYVIKNWNGKIKFHCDKENKTYTISSPEDYITYLESKPRTYTYDLYLRDQHGKLRINRFLELNNLDEEFRLFCTDYNFPCKPIPRLNSNKNKVLLTKDIIVRVKNFYSNNQNIYDALKSTIIDVQ